MLLYYLGECVLQNRSFIHHTVVISGLQLSAQHLITINLIVITNNILCSYVPGIVLRILHILSYSILLTTPGNRLLIFPLMNKKTKAYKD